METVSISLLGDLYASHAFVGVIAQNEKQRAENII